MEALWIVHNGVPFDVAFRLSDEERAAYAIVFSEFHGHKFNWSTFTFDKETME